MYVPAFELLLFSLITIAIFKVDTTGKLLASFSQLYRYACHQGRSRGEGGANNDLFSNIRTCTVPLASMEKCDHKVFPIQGLTFVGCVGSSNITNLGWGVALAPPLVLTPHGLTAAWSNTGCLALQRL
jgi:hypothetical protein